MELHLCLLPIVNPVAQLLDLIMQLFVETADKHSAKNQKRSPRDQVEKQAQLGMLQVERLGAQHDEEKDPDNGEHAAENRRAEVEIVPRQEDGNEIEIEECELVVYEIADCADGD